MNGSERANHPADRWARGDSYEPYVGRWSRLVAAEFLPWLAIAPGSRWLDVGCGTGALSETILRSESPSAVKGVDLSAAFIDHVRDRVLDARARFEIGDAQSLADADGIYDAAVSALMLNFVPQPQRAVAEMARVTRPGGTVAVYVWDYAGRMQMLRHFWNAAVALFPDARDLDEGLRFPLCQPEPLVTLLRSAGLLDVEAQALDIITDFASFDDYWSPFLGGQGPAPTYLMSIDIVQRAALRERIRASLPAAINGRISLIARAWAVRGKRPAL